MQNFSYVGLNHNGRKVRGETVAENEFDLEARLKEIDIDLISCKGKKERKAGTFSKIKLKDMIVFCLHMEQLDKAGVPLHDSLADARDATDSPKLKNVLGAVYEAVKSGTQFSEALNAHPTVFDSIFVGLIAAGEKTGNLSEAFGNLIEHMKWTNELQRKVKKAIRYPIVLLVVLSAVITILMLFVVPKLVDFIVAQGFHIPIHTELLIRFSAFFGENWWIILSTPVIMFISHKFFYRVSEPYAYFIDDKALKAPIIGPVIRKINLARFTHFFSVMFRSGIDILDSLKAGQGVMNNRVLKEAIDTVHKSVTEGNQITNSIRMSNHFPNLVVRMFKVGEESGNMNDALENINFFYNREVDDAVEGMVGMIQPIMTVVMGSMIFWVIAGVFGPLYQSFSEMDF